MFFFSFFLDRDSQRFEEGFHDSIREKRNTKKRMQRKQTTETEEARAQTTLNDENNGPYTTKNTLGKAVSEVKRALPATPNRE